MDDMTDQGDAYSERARRLVELLPTSYEPESVELPRETESVPATTDRGNSELVGTQPVALPSAPSALAVLHARETSLYLPQREHHRAPWKTLTFLVMVLIPTVCISIYLCYYASNQYISEFRFSVLQSTPVIAGQPIQQQSLNSSSVMGSISSGLSAVMGSSSGLSGATPQNFIVVDYLKSRDAVEQLEKEIKLRSRFERPEIDRVTRYFIGKTDDDFYAYWQSIMFANFDQVTNLAKVQVRAFSPDDALLIANGLVKLSEKLINDISDRANADMVRFAAEEAKRAEARFSDASQRLLAFRNKEGVIDPKASIVPTNVQQIQSVEQSVNQFKVQIDALNVQRVGPEAPTRRWLTAQLLASEQLLARLKAETPQSKASPGSISDVVGRFESLNVEVQYAQQMVLSTEQALDQARANAAAQHLYLTPYVKPRLITAAAYPQRLFVIGLTFIGLLALWSFCLFLIRSIYDHAF